MKTKEATATLVGSTENQILISQKARPGKFCGKFVCRVSKLLHVRHGQPQTINDYLHMAVT